MKQTDIDIMIKSDITGIKCDMVRRVFAIALLIAISHFLAYPEGVLSAFFGRPCNYIINPGTTAAMFILGLLLLIFAGVKMWSIRGCKKQIKKLKTLSNNVIELRGHLGEQTDPPMNVIQEFIKFASSFDECLEHRKRILTTLLDMCTDGMAKKIKAKADLLIPEAKEVMKWWHVSVLAKEEAIYAIKWAATSLDMLRLGKDEKPKTFFLDMAEEALGLKD